MCDLPKTEDGPINITPFWWVQTSKKRAWVDYQNDVTTKDIVLAMQEGFRSAEHVKRYTTLGMAPDQGKSSNVIGLGIMAKVANQTMKDIGTTIFSRLIHPFQSALSQGLTQVSTFARHKKLPAINLLVRKMLNLLSLVLG